MTSKIYKPAEDSFFLSSFVKSEISRNNSGKILDMGSGSGIQAETAINAGANAKNVMAVDVNLLAVTYLKNKFPESSVVQSDLFEKVAGKFHLIIFNPPYLPANEFDVGIDTTGGEKGSEIINEFLKEASKHLSENGKIFLLTSSLTKGLKWKDYRRKLLGKKKIFFEELYVWELQPIK